MDQGFPPVRHPRPDPISPDLHFDDVIDSITVGDDVYVRLSACESVTVPPELQQERGLSEEEQEYAPVPTPRKSRSPSNVIPLTITTGTVSSPSEEPCGEFFPEARSRSATNESKESFGRDECGVDFSISVSTGSQSGSRDLDQSQCSASCHKDSIDSIEEQHLFPPERVGSAMLRTPSAPILCSPMSTLERQQATSSIYDEEEARDTVRTYDVTTSQAEFVIPENNSFPGTSQERDLDAIWRPLGSIIGSSRYSVFKNDQIDGGFYEPELKFCWSANISGQNFKVEPSSSKYCKKFDLMIIGITKDDNLPEIWLMSTRKDQKREIFSPKKLSEGVYEPWRLERRSELKCDIKVNSDDTHYIDFIVTLETTGEADLVYGKLLEASNYIIFKSSLGHVTTPNERKWAIEEIMGEEVCNQFCAECGSKFIGVFDLWMSLASWSLVCTKCSNWHRRFVSSARHLWLDDFNPLTWQAIKSCSSSLMSHYWYDDIHPDHLLDGYELLREDLDPIFKECNSERHIYAKYCSLKFLKPFQQDKNEESKRQLSDLLYVQLKQKTKNVHKVFDLVFRGATLSESNKQDLKQHTPDDKFHVDLMKLVDFVSYTRNQLSQKVEVFEVDYPLSTRCLADFFTRNPNLKSVILVYSSEQTNSMFNKSSVKTYKTEIFELIPFPNEPVAAASNPEEPNTSKSFVGSPLIKDFYNMFLSRLYAVSFKRSLDIICRPRKIGIVHLAEEMRSVFCKICAILDNFVLYLFDCSEDKQMGYRELDLRYVYSLTKATSNVHSSTSSLLSTQSEFILKIDYIEPNPGKNKYPVYYVKVDDESDYDTWFKLLSDWINVTQSPLLHRQPIERHYLGMFCNYAVAILIGDKLMPVTCELGPKKHWLMTSTDSLPAYEREVLARFCFKSDMPRTSANSSSSRLLGKILSPAAFIQLLVKFTQDHLMIPARFVHKIQTMERRKTLVLSGFDPDTLDSEAFQSMVNSLSIAYKNTLLELFWYFKVIISRSDDLEVNDVVTWMSEVNFCNNLFTPDVLRHCLTEFERVFKVSEEFSSVRQKQIELISKINEKKPAETLQVPFIRKNWSEYDRANECEYENSLEPIKFNRPEDFASWTNQQFLDALVNCMTPLSGTSTVSAGIGVSQTVIPGRKEEVTYGSPLYYLLVERLIVDKHVVRILPISEQIDEKLVPVTVVMQGMEFVTAFQMLAREEPKKHFTVEVVRIKWNSVQKQPERGNTKLGSCSLSVGDKSIKLFRKSGNAPEIVYLEHYTIYFGVPSKSQKQAPWKRSLSLIGNSYCFGLTFDNLSAMYACFWSLQHQKLGQEGVKKWLPIEKFGRRQMGARGGSSARTRQTIDGCHLHATGWEAAGNFTHFNRASNVIMPQQNFATNRDSRFFSERKESAPVANGGEVKGQRKSSRYQASGSPQLGRLSRSMDMLQDENRQPETGKLKSIRNSSLLAFGATDRSSIARMSVTKALKKKWSMRKHKEQFVVE